MNAMHEALADVIAAIDGFHADTFTLGSVAITCRRQGDGYVAIVNGDNRVWGYGATLYEAIGSAFLTGAAIEKGATDDAEKGGKE